MSALLTSEQESSSLLIAPSSLPTLSASSYGTSNNGTRDGVEEFNLKGKPSLETMAKRGMLPTLTVDGNYNRAGVSEKSGDGLITALKKLPTLTASAADRSTAGSRSGATAQGGPSLTEELMTRMLPTLCARDDHGPGRKHSQGGADLPGTLGGHLNPEWCLWFMGFPEAWLDVDDAPAFARSATRSSRSAPRSSATSSESSSSETLPPKKSTP
jgi:hypothetical protein